MDKIFEALFKYLFNPLTTILQSIGLGEDSSKALSGALIAFMVWQAVLEFKHSVADLLGPACVGQCGVCSMIMSTA